LGQLFGDRARDGADPMEDLPNAMGPGGSLLQTVVARRAVLGTGDADGRGVEMNLLPAKIHQLADPQRMPERH
jgi:hypothetical protein